MRERFKVAIVADLEQADSLIQQEARKHGKKKVVNVNVEAGLVDVRLKLLRRIQRVEQNPGLYGDQVAMYRQAYDRLLANEQSLSPAEALVEAMLDEGSDPWVSGADSCAVVRDGETRWFVFGFSKG
jgi:Rod binding domain-containing protein